MKIDICMVLNNAEHFLPLHYAFWKDDSRVRLLIGNSSGLNVNFPNMQFVPLQFEDSFDGYQHGSGLDQLVKYSDADLLILQDPDVFMLKPDIIQAFLDINVDYFGISDVYHSSIGVFDKSQKIANNGILKTVTPFCSCLFTRKECIQETFILSTNEMLSMRREVGWRLRDRIWAEKLKTASLIGFRYSENCPPFYGSPDNPWIVHLTQHFFRNESIEKVKEFLSNHSEHWSNLLRA